MRESQIVKQNSDRMHQHNLKLLYRLIYQAGTTTKARLTQQTGLSPTSIGRIVGELIQSGFVHEVGQESKGIGRKAALLELCSDRIHAIGVRVDKGSICAGFIDLYGHVKMRMEIKLSANIEQQPLADEIAAVVQALIHKSAGALNGTLAGIGISVPGPVSWPSGIMKYSPQFHWGNFAMRQEVSERLHLPVLVENDVKATAVSEHLFGTMKEHMNFLTFYVGSGVGAAVISNGSIYRGPDNIVGEIGHVTIDPRGTLCDCGRRGCFQTYANVPSIEERYGAPLEEILLQESAGVPEAVRYLQEIVELYAVMTSNLANYYNPECVLYFGSLLQRWPNFTTRVKQKSEEFLWHAVCGEFKIVSTNTNIDVLPAASIVLSEFWASECLPTDFPVFSESDA